MGLCSRSPASHPKVKDAETHCAGVVSWRSGPRGAPHVTPRGCLVTAWKTDCALTRPAALGGRARKKVALRTDCSRRPVHQAWLMEIGREGGAPHQAPPPSPTLRDAGWQHIARPAGSVCTPEAGKRCGAATQSRLDVPRVPEQLRSKPGQQAVRPEGEATAGADGAGWGWRSALRHPSWLCALPPPPGTPAPPSPRASPLSPHTASPPRPLRRVTVSRPVGRSLCRAGCAQLSRPTLGAHGGRPCFCKWHSDGRHADDSW